MTYKKISSRVKPCKLSIIYTRGAPLIFEHFRNHDCIKIAREYLDIYIVYAILYTAFHTSARSLFIKTLYDFKYVIKWMGYNALTFED